MGSLKDEMRGLREDRQPCEKADDGVCSEGSDGGGGGGAPAGRQPLTGQERETQGDYLQKAHVDENPTSKDQALSGGDCGTVDPSDSKRERVLTDVVPEGVETITASLNSDATIDIELVSDGGEVAGAEKTAREKGKSAESEKISVPVPSTPDPCDPRSPAPSGQQHMRTQVSLEVVQCCSVATSPMTPPEGGHSFFFPSSFGKSGAAGTETKDAELQASRRVEFCSVATSPFPMTPKTPSATAFPELTGRETVPKEEKVRGDEEQRENVQKESFPPTRSQAEAESEVTGALNPTASKEPTEGFTSPDTINCAASGSVDSQGSLRDSNQQSKQQRMGSMDQDITILVTHYVNNEEEEEEKEETPLCSTQPDVGKIEELEEEGLAEISNTDQPQKKTEEPSTNQRPSQSGESQVKETKDACEETKPHIPESPAPFGCHNIRTQVSLEVVQCQSAATSPMTPPEGDQAFYFPSSLGKCTSVGAEMKDAEMQVGQQVEFRSVATAPMTPRTPTVTTFPEVRKDTGVEEKIVEEEEDTKEQVEEDEKKKTTEENEAKADEQEKGKEGGVEKSEDKGKEKGVKEDEECREEGGVTGEGDKEEKGGEKTEERCKEVKGEGGKEERGEGRSKEEEVTDEEEKEEKGEEKCKGEGGERCKRDGEAMDEEDEEEKDEDKSEEPVQEVSWDEKGMTWEVYGAVVEVAVLGSAIQKHLEKQVKKQKLQAALPPPPPLNPSATPLAAETAPRGGSGSGRSRAGKQRGEQDGKVGRRRRNPFRQLMENMQQQ